ncbi:hypothetical protein IR152_10445 [Clostridioides sp. ES-S-0108-01]|uniref:hypothetical protein n=1 Tax=Clostridioides sp. ES-S-0108-01 TaxID=2770773 RepID=UPI001D0C33B4|nr:hypothetical protein [Clostridioides sp. ES-S-0108-01]
MTKTNNSYLAENNTYNSSKKDFTEIVTIDNQEYVFILRYVSMIVFLKCKFNY